MKKNQRSIDGFTPRRRAESLSLNNNPKETVKKPDLKVVKSQKRGSVDDFIQTKKPEKNEKDSGKDIEAALQNLEIEELQEAEHKERVASKKHQKLLRKFEKSNAKREKKGKKPLTLEQFKKRRSIKRFFTIAILLLLVIGGWLIYPTLNTLNKITNGNILGVIENKKLKADSNGRTNILIFGTSPKGWDGEELTDSIMVASVNQENKEIKTVSLPRDLWVKHTCKTWLGTTAGKLNETYGCGYHDAKNSGSSEEDAEKAGQKVLSEKVKEILGLDIQYVVHGNWKVLIDAVNAVGGIDVKVEAYDGSNRVYDVATKINYQSGKTYHMDGAAALAFSRARGSEGGVGLSGSNFDRERNQQKILKATLAKINQQKMNPITLLSIANSLGENIHHTFESSELTTVSEIAQSFNSGKMTSLPLVNESDASGNYFTTGHVGSVSAVIPKAGLFDYSEIQAYISKNTLGGDIVKESAKIKILNGTNYSGLAAQEQKKLEKEGYTIQDIDSAPTHDYEKTKVYYIKQESKPNTVKKLESKYSTKAEKLPSKLSSYGEDVDIIIILGEDNGE